LADYFAQMVTEGVDTAIMEVSSHALDQRRTLGIHFRAAAFTNLTPEHLDYHKDLPSYRAAKALLFAGLEREAVAVLNRDDEAADEMARVAKARVIWFSLEREAEVHAAGVKLDVGGARFTLQLAGQGHDVRLPLLGRHNVYNALTAAGLAWGLGLPPEAIVAGLEALKAVPGRLEPVDCGQPFAVLVDYAHTDDALENALSAVRPLAAGRVIVVFGCGGDRDRAKRPRMARAAERLADLVIVTSDNPRTEDPELIAEEIFAGFSAPQKVLRRLDRSAAIAEAVALARPRDILLIAGKGHETYQVVGQKRLEFDDRKKVAEALRARGYAAAREVSNCS
jgi:UDP-N-acetylmuramoyl-L-alanyl-D-glutamate--2,6-diaminopimelate ligase